MEPEQYFLRYAFPCAFIAHQRGVISQRELDGLEKDFHAGNLVARTMLVRVFHKAFERLRKLGDPWDIDTMKRYFEDEHNRLIEAEDMLGKNPPGSLKELCLIREATVVEKKGDIYMVQYEDKKRPVMSPMPVEVGDAVVIHYGYIVDKKG